VWVGTESEYLDRKARSIEAQHGYREVGNTRAFVDGSLPAVNVGDEEVAGIASAVLFSGKIWSHYHAPRPRSGYHYVMLSWTTGGGARISARLADTKHRRLFDPFFCINDSAPRCLWQLPDTELGAPIVVVFIAPGKRPGATALPSLASLEYRANRGSAGLSAADLAALRQLDPRIP
jgi:hypothetical protein